MNSLESCAFVRDIITNLEIIIISSWIVLTRLLPNIKNLINELYIKSSTFPIVAIISAQTRGFKVIENYFKQG